MREARQERRGAAASDQRPWQLAIAAAFYAVTGVGLVASGVLGLLPSDEPRHPIAIVLPALIQSAIGARPCLHRDRALAPPRMGSGDGLNLGIAGVVASAILALGETTCLRPLGPTLAPCQAGDLVGGLLAVAAVVGFGFSVWAIVSLRAQFR